nr:uncharacterized protein LOC117684564 [Crassostrea gigas]
MPPKKRVRRDDVATGGVPPPTEVQMGEKGPKRTRKQSETDTINVLPNIDYELLAKKIVNQQKAAGEKPNIGESVGQPPMVNSVEDTAPVVGEEIPAAATIPAAAAATIPASALGTLLDNVFTEWRLRESPEKCSDISISNVDDVTNISFVTPEFIWLDNKQWAMKIDQKGKILSKLVIGDLWGSA